MGERKQTGDEKLTVWLVVLTAESQLEVAFFQDLQAELKKISLFYASEEKRFAFRFHQLRSVLKDLKVRQ